MNSGQSLLEPIIAELSLFWLFILGFKVQITSMSFKSSFWALKDQYYKDQRH